MKIRTLLAATLLMLVAGCLPLSIGDPDKSVFDEHLLGVWHFNADNEQLWYVHKLDTRTYLIQLYSFERKDGVAAEKGGPRTFRAWLTPIGGKQFLSMQAFDPRNITEPDAKDSVNRYVVAKLELTGDSVAVQGVSDQFLKDNHITTSAEFEKALADHIDEKTTYVDPNTYERVDLKTPGPAGELIDLVSKAADQ